MSELLVALSDDAREGIAAFFDKRPPALHRALAIPPPQTSARRESRDPGLCAACANARRVVSARGSEFWLCALSARDPAFAKYPRLPVLRCPGYHPGSPEVSA